MGERVPRSDVKEAAETRDGTGSLAKMLTIFDLFSSDEPVLSTASIIEGLRTSRSTGYRYIKTLHDAGLLTTVRTGYYSLGPRIIEMDMQIRTADPLLLASRGVLEELVGTIGHSATLCTAFRDSVLCIGECRAPQSPENRFHRGQRRSMFQGAVSKVILAYLPHHSLKAIYARHAEAIDNAGLGDNWRDFRKGLGQIKRNGYLVTLGEFNPGVQGVAAPILTDQKAVLGSVGVAWDQNERRDVEVGQAVLAVQQAARTISQRLADSQGDA